MKCIRCDKREIHVKKSGLCKPCYNRKYRDSRIKPTYTRHRAEIEFIKNYFNHDNWVYEPVVFRLKETKYRPDFYDSNRNVFIEVVGSKQAYHANKHKYIEMSETYPIIKMEFRDMDGNEIDVNNGRIKWLNNA